jgi:equilibrative nucleoside transporter 1/2/3
MMSVSTIASTVYNYYLSQAQTGVRYYFRLNLGLGITIVVFIIMAISCISEFFITMADPMFFTVLMGMVLVSAMATCLAQNGTMAIVNVLGGIYANAVMVGQAVAGVLPAMALIISILVVGDKPLDQKDQVEKDYGTFVYYITASLISIASVLLLVTTHRLKEQATYLSLTELVDDDFTNCPTEHDLQEVEPAQSTHVPFGLLWEKLKLIVLSIFLIFSITLIFPVFASVIQSNNEVSGKWYFQKNVYIPFIYLIWNLGDLMGRVLCGIPRCKMLINDPRRLIMYSVARLAFIPLFLTCNLHPQAGESSAWIKSDLWYIALQFVFGLTNGQLCTSCFMIVRDYCDTDEEKEAAGGFTTVFLSVGLAVGAVLSYLLVWFIS